MAAWLQLAVRRPDPRPPLPPARRLHGGHIYTSKRQAGRARPLPARGRRPRAEQRGRPSPRVLAFSAVSRALRLRAPARPGRAAALARVRRRRLPSLAFNTAASFVTNTNWQSYSGESRWATWSRWPASPCRTSSRRRSASRWPSHWSAGSPARGPRRSATSGSTWSAATCGCCCRSPSSARSCSSRWAWCRTSTRLPSVTTVAGAHADDPGRTGRLAGGDQGARHQRRRLLQRELGAPVREPERA